MARFAEARGWDEVRCARTPMVFKDPMVRACRGASSRECAKSRLTWRGPTNDLRSGAIADSTFPTTTHTQPLHQNPRPPPPKPSTMLSHISSDDFEFPSTPPSTTGTGMPDDLPASPYYDEAMRRYQALQTAAQRRAQLLPYANNPLNRTLYNTKDALFQDLGKRTNLRLEYYMIKSIHADLVLEGKDEDAVACEQIESVPCEGIKGGQLRAWVGTATKERLRKFVKYLQFDHVVVSLAPDRPSFHLD